MWTTAQSEKDKVNELSLWSMALLV